ncbi:MAG: LuxR C-terminal-related transcriptional regulator [Pseudomonadota bacterium]
MSNQAASQSEIETVLKTDIESYLRRDKAAWETCWVRDDRFKSIMECGTMQVALSYDQFRRNVFGAMDDEPEPVRADVQMENLTIEVHGDLAWATYEEIVTNTSNPLVAPNHSHNFRLLAREDGHWCILFHGCWAEPLRDTDIPAVEVTEGCEVVWLNPSAAAELKSFAGLTLSHGILRATKPELDVHLRNAIIGAHNLTGFGKFNRAKSEGGGEVSFPVVVGQKDDGTDLFCRVKVADGRVYVLFGRGLDLSSQVELVQAIYGLSKSQTEIAKKITQGLDLESAAEALEITKNTARTHLRRVYEKVGVNSQIELIRLIAGFAVRD